MNCVRVCVTVLWCVNSVYCCIIMKVSENLSFPSTVDVAPLRFPATSILGNPVTVTLALPPVTNNISELFGQIASITDLLFQTCLNIGGSGPLS